MEIGTSFLEEARLPVDALGLRVIRLCLEHRTNLRGLPVRSQSNKNTVAACVNHQGGMSSATVALEASHFLRWVVLAPSAVHIPGIEN